MLNVDKLSYWEKKSFTKDVDFIIIGAGIVGYSTAIHLREKHPQSKILILERGYLPTGASSKNAGFACFGSATELYDDIQNYGEETVWETVKLRWEGLKALRQLISDEQLKFEENGSWDLITENELDLFSKIKPLLPYYNEQLEKITGEKDVYSIDDQLDTQFGFQQIVTSIKNKKEGQIDTASMNKAFYKKVVQLDIDVLFGIDVQEISQHVVHTNHGDIQSKGIFICTNAFAHRFLPNDDINPARAQVVITKPINFLNLKGTFHFDKGYFYFRNIDNRILLGGGRNIDFKGETTEDLVTTDQIINRLKELLSTVILPNTPFEIESQWAGIMGVGNTKKPIIKKIEDGIYCGVRLGGMGVAVGTLVGKQLAEMCEEIPSQKQSALN